MAVSESNMAQFKMAAIIKLSQNEQVKFFFVQNGWIQDSRIQDGYHHQFEWECMSEVFLCKWLNTRWQNSRWLSSSGWVRMNDFESDWIRLSQSFVQHGWIQDGRIQDGCHHLVSQIELVWVRVRVEEECLWVNLRENNKCLNPRWQCLIPTWQSSRWLISSSWVRMNEFESVWTSLSQSFVQNGWIQDGRIKDGKIQDGCHH